MTLFTFGSGPPLVLLPGLQGRWEWMRPATVALSRWFRVVTFSLPGERTSGFRLEPGRFDCHVDQLDAVMDRAAITRAAICGVSYGGLIALRYAALRPDRVEHLVLVSTPGPAWQLSERQERYVNAPRRSMARFLAGAQGRFRREVVAAIPDRRARWRFLSAALTWMVRSPASPVLMAARAKCARGHDFRADAAQVQAPTLVITGEPELDQVVPVEGTRQYLQVIPGAVGQTLERTGHFGLVTRAEAFAEIIREFCAPTTRSRA